MYIQNVSKTYRQKEVVQEVNLELSEHKLTAFIGPNGAGKSTLLSMMSRLLEKDCGDIYISGNEITTFKSKDLAKKLAILKQSNQIDLVITVRELVSFGRFPYSQGHLTKEDHQLIEEALHYLGLENLADRQINELSGGQLQRVYIAMILAQDTDYILLDEPLNNLDMSYAVQLMKVLRRLVDEKGKTVVIVLHDINFASSYADEIVAMKAGKVVYHDITENVIQKPVLDELYEMNIQVCELAGKRFCLYFND